MASFTHLPRVFVSRGSLHFFLHNLTFSRISMTMDHFNEIPAGPPPSPDLASWSQELHPFDPGNVPLAVIVYRPMSHPIAEAECSGDEPGGPGGEEDGGLVPENDTEDDDSSIFNAARSDDSDSSIQTTTSENEQFAGVTVAIQVQVHLTEDFRRDGGISGEVSSSDRHHQSPPLIFWYVLSSTSAIG